MNTELRHKLVSMAGHDLAVRQSLIDDGSLAKCIYHPRMAVVHEQNAERLAGIIDQYGWPDNNLVGEDGAEAAWLIAQHAIGKPEFMRRCLVLIKRAATNNDVSLWQAAMMEDRIRMYEGKPQIYGTQFVPDKDGQLVAYVIEAQESVNARRLSVGLNLLEERLAQVQAQAAQEKLSLSKDFEIKYERWLRAVGWRE